MQYRLRRGRDLSEAKIFVLNDLPARFGPFQDLAGNDLAPGEPFFDVMSYADARWTHEGQWHRMRNRIPAHYNVFDQFDRSIVSIDTLKKDAQIRAAIEEIGMHPESTSQEVDFILIAKNLERVADHATNIAEDVILVAQGRNIKHAEKLAG